MAVFYGSDTVCLYDLPRIDLQVVDPVQLIGQRLARRLQTPRGALALIGDDPNFGWDVRQYINGRFNPTTLGVAESQIANECMKDEQVQAATARLTLSGLALTIDIEVESSAGPFSLTMQVSQLTVDLIFGFNR